MRLDSSGESGRLRAAAGLLRLLARRAWFVEDEVAAIAALVRPGATCIDVGAEYGVYTVAMAAAVGPTGTVHAIEPQPDVHRVLARTVTVVGAADRVRLHHTALGTAPARAELSVPVRRGLPVHGRAFLTAGADHGGPNDEDFGASRRVAVDVTTLDRLAATEGIARLDLLKADVEGAELHVLRGGLATLRAHRPLVQLEVEAPHLDRYGLAVEDLTDLLCGGLGYAMHGWADGGWGPVDAVTPSRRNYLFVP